MLTKKKFITNNHILFKKKRCIYHTNHTYPYGISHNMEASQIYLRGPHTCMFHSDEHISFFKK